MFQVTKRLVFLRLSSIAIQHGNAASLGTMTVNSDAEEFFDT